ncbi:Hint domain-containing protein [Falsirhodobacter sp. alg1]|uniref:Hint domain-containing protein n=1 Tax=Falsirhodobacter sp. alg1 TaxID=1472418 RepID=UPI001EDA27AB|nr:Hint domain-containing protein [Falsirhodobacter sp. alg1]
MVISSAAALGDNTSLYRLTWTGNVSNEATTDEFSNGQGWTLDVYTQSLDSDGRPITGDEGWTTVFANMSPRNDLVSGVGAGDDYIVFDTMSGGWLVYDLGGGLSQSPTDLTYLEIDQNGELAVGDNDSQLDFTSTAIAYNISTYCFAGGTQILTSDGLRPVQDLKIGDMVNTADHGPQPIRWIGSRKVNTTELLAFPNLQPIRIRAGALGLNTPATDLVVSPQHRILVRSAIAERMFGTSEVLIAANKLLAIDGIDIVNDTSPVEYFHILFDKHQVVFANGAAAESLFTGPEAMRAVSPEARAEILHLFPGIMAPDFIGKAARYIPEKGKLMKKLAQRHQQNARPLCDA